jgi:Zn-dependent peptidase ImmA (M78 family)
VRRGFKTQAEAISHEVRAELQLTPHDRLDPLVLAEHLAIPIDPVTDLIEHGAGEDAIACLLADEARFSAVTVFRGTRCRIYYNPRHSARRRANSIAHELAHVLLEHEPAAAVSHDGLRNWNATQEEEADWQGGALLVPRVGALAWMSQGGSLAGGADQFGVSLELFTWRVNHTGVAVQVRRRAAAR